jgi:hypothetical protein
MISLRADHQIMCELASNRQSGNAGSQRCTAVEHLTALDGCHAAQSSPYSNYQWGCPE